LTQTVTPAAAPDVKTPAARLLDLLIGWAEWTEAHADTVDADVTAEELFDLYQEAGGLLASLPEGDQAAERRAIIAFFVDRIMPTVLRGAGKERRQAAA
jgi:hypothetical protein